MPRDITEQGPHGGPKEMSSGDGGYQQGQSEPTLDPRVKVYQKWIRASESAKSKALKWSDSGDKLFRGYGKSGPDEGQQPIDDERESRSVKVLKKINRLRRKINASVNQVYSRNPTFIGSAKRPIMVPDEAALQQMQQEEMMMQQAVAAGQAPPPQGPTPFQQMQAGMIPPPMRDISDILADTVSQIMANIFMESSLKAEAKSAVREAHHRSAGVIQVGYEFDENQGVDDIFFRRRSFRQFIIDPGAQIYDGEVRRCRYMGLRWDLTEEEAKGLGMDWDALADKENQSSDEDPKGCVYQIWDKQNEFVVWVPAHGDSFAKEPAPWPWKIDGFPFEIIKLTEDEGQQWSRPIILEAEGLQAEMDVMREEITMNVTFSRPAVLYDSDLLDENEAIDLSGRRDSGWKGVRGLGQNPNAVQTINTDRLSPEYFAHYGRCNAEMDEVLGTSATGQLRTTKNTSATEISAISANEDSMVSEKTDIVTDAINRLSRKAIQIIRQTYTTERVSQITGPDGAKQWVKWTGNVLQEMDVAVESGSIQREDTEVKRQIDLNMLKILQPLGQQGLDVLTLAINVLKRFNFKNPEAYRLQPVQAPQSEPTLPPGQPGPGPTQQGGGGVAGGIGGNVREAVAAQASPMTGGRMA